MDKKRLLYLIIFTLVAVGLGYLMYRVFFAPLKVKPTPTDQTPTGQTPTGGLPTAGEGGDRPTTGGDQGQLPTGGSVDDGGQTPTTGLQLVSLLSDISATNPKLDNSGNVNLYNSTDGKFYRLKSNGQVELLSDQVFYQVENVNWSPARNEAVLEYPDGSNIYYNFETKTQATLPKHWENFSFASDGSKIAAKSVALSPENNWLITSNPNGSEIELIEPMGENESKVIVDWSPNGQVVALSKTGEALGADRQEILLIGLSGENFKSLTVEGRGINSRWSQDGNKLLYSVYSARSNFKPELWVVNASGDDINTGRKFLNLNTWAEKCVFANEKHVYCAVPQTLQTGAGFQPSVADSTPDQIYRIDINTGLRTLIPTDTTYTVKDIMVSESGDRLFFTDKVQTGVFEVKL